MILLCVCIHAHAYKCACEGQRPTLDVGPQVSDISLWPHGTAKPAVQRAPGTLLSLPPVSPPLALQMSAALSGFLHKP